MGMIVTAMFADGLDPVEGYPVPKASPNARIRGRSITGYVISIPAAPGIPAISA